MESRIGASCIMGVPRDVLGEEGEENERKLSGCPNVADARCPPDGRNSKSNSGGVWYGDN